MYELIVQSTDSTVGSFQAHYPQSYSKLCDDAWLQQLHYGKLSG